jgi:dipeptidyl aminopeptidase/acylaminoacyl peptidase
VAYEASNPQRVVRFEYEGQRFAKSGYPMLAGASAISVWVTEVSTGKSFQLTSSEASSWSPSWSTDGMRLAFYSDRSGQAALWVWDRQSKASKQISPVEIFFSWWRERPLWSADGKTILTKVLPEGMGLEDVLKLSPFYADALNKGKIKWADPKAPTVHVYSYHPNKDSARDKTSENSGSGDFSAFFDAMYLSDLVRIDLASGKVTRIAKRVRPMWYGYSPDQTRIAYASIDGVVPRTQQNIFNLRIYSFAKGATTNLAKGFMDPNDLTTEVSWSPDGTRVAYHDTGRTAERAAYVVDVETGAKVKVSDGIPESSRTFSWGPPLWDKTGTKLYLLDSEAGRLWEVAADGTKTREIASLPGLAIKDMATDEAASTYWSPDNGRTLYVRTHDGESKKDAIYSVRVDGGETKKVYEGDESISLREMGALTGTSHDDLLVFCSESATRPLDLWTLDVGTGHTHQISSLNPQYDENTMGKTRIINWLSLRGEHLRGALLLPSDYEQGKRYPMVVWIYGGDMGSDKVNRFAFGWGTTFNPQMWASRGYAVLYPDIPLHPGTPVDDLVSAVIPGVNKAVELGFADATHLGVMGQSFGGYKTIALLTRTSIFKAAVATSAASTDLFAAYTYFLNGTAPSEGYYEEGQGGMKGSPWEFKTRYYDNSPFFFLDRVTTPLMIQRGTADLISIQSGNVYNALRRLGKDVELLEYDTEDHVVQQPVNVIDFWNRRIEWLGRYLNPRDETGSAAGGNVQHDQ